MAVISKTLSEFGRNGSLYGIINGGWGAGGVDIGPVTKISAKVSSGQGDGLADKNITWGSISSGSVSVVGTPVLTIPAGYTITHIALIAMDSGSFNDYVNIVLVAIDSETFTYAGTITITSCTLTCSATLT